MNQGLMPISETSQLVKSNLLISAARSLPVEQSRIIHYALASINSKQKNPGYIDIFSSEYAKLYALNRTTAWKNLKSDIKALQKEPFEIKGPPGSNAVWSISWLSDFAYINDDDANGGRLKLRFSEAISPFLFELKNNFTVLHLEHTKQLHKVPMALSIYERLVAYANKETGIAKGHSGILPDKLYTFEFTVELLREIGGYEDSYPTWSRFKDKIIDKAIKAINTYTDLIIAMEPIKSGKSVVGVKLTFSLNVDNEIVMEPMRPRLRPRPHAKEGSDLHGKWMRENLARLLEYRAKRQQFFLKDIDRLEKDDKYLDAAREKRRKAHLPIADTRRVIEYAKKLGDKFLVEEFKLYEAQQLAYANK